MKHGLTITRPGATLPPIAPTAGDHQRWRGCFPSTDEGAWENVTAAEKGLSDDYADYYDAHIFRLESDDEVVHGDAPEAPEGEEVTEEEAELTSSDLDNIEIEVVGSPAAPVEGAGDGEEGRGDEEDEELTSSDLDNIEIEVVGSPAAPASSPPPPPPRPHPRGRDHDHDHGHHRADDRGPQAASPTAAGATSSRPLTSS